MDFTILRGSEKAIFRIGGKLVKVAKANRNGEVVLVVTEDDSSATAHELMHFRLPEQGRREDRLSMPTVQLPEALELAVA